MHPAPPPPPFRHLDTTTGVAALAEALCDPPDMTPTLVVTAVNQTRGIPLDLAHIADEVGDAARLVVITDPNLTRALTGLMPPGTTPYNGAARIYPAHDLTWTGDCFAGDLLFANIRPDNGARIAGVISARLLTMAENAQGFEALDALADRSAGAVAEDADPRPFRGEFTGASSATVGMISSADAPGVGMLRVDLDTLLPGAPVVIGSIFADGDEVSGHFDASGAVVDVAGMRTAEQLAGDLVVQHCYPAVVTGVVAKSQVSVQVVPGKTSYLTQSGIGTSVSAGDVIAVQVQSVGERHGTLKIIVGPAPEDATVEDAPSLRTGGPAWVSMHAPLDETTSGAESSTSRNDVTVGVPAGSVAELEGLRRKVPQLKHEKAELSRTIGQLHEKLEIIGRENDHTWQENDRLTDENERLQEALRRAGVHVPTTLPGAGQGRGPRRRVRTEVEVVHTERPFIGNEFTDPADQLDLEVRVEWARRVDAAEKAAHPLRFRFGVQFLGSVRRVIDDSEALRWKLPRVMMWIASGYEDRTTRPHQFRISDAGGAPYLVRDDRAKAYRVDLETNTAAARRLHYWKLPDGTVEFQRVGFHDEPGF